MLVSRAKGTPHYAAGHWAGGWAVYENGRVMAACNNEAEARTIAQALNFQRLMLTLHSLPIEPPPEPGLN